ncbi:hypothetical protein FACS1894153_3090 [Bacteroidia bacterium]|nr:hypothetical protein FACS1894153_3090 [Bacteroidia bacterium]
MIIKFSGLTNGKHSFDFNVDKNLFVDFGYDRVCECNLNANVVLEKSDNMLNIIVAIKGTVSSVCERCLDNIDIPLDVAEKLVVKLNQREHVFDDFFWELTPQDFKVDLTHFIYETIILALPQEIKHNISDCDPEVLKFLS